MSNLYNADLNVTRMGFCESQNIPFRVQRQDLTLDDLLEREYRPDLVSFNEEDGITGFIEGVGQIPTFNEKTGLWSDEIEIKDESELDAMGDEYGA